MSEDMIQKRLDKKLKLTRALEETTRKNLYDWKSVKSDSLASFENESFARPKSGAKEPSAGGFKKSESFIDLKAHESQGFRICRSATSNKLAAKPASKSAKAKEPDAYGEVDAVIKDTAEYLKELKSKRLQAEQEEAKGPVFQINGSTEEKSAFLATELNKRLDRKNPFNILELDLSQLEINAIGNLSKFRNLQRLNLSCNRISKIENLNFRYLIELDLYANGIQALENLENLPELQFLKLQSNRIKELNAGLVGLKRLEYLRLDRNEIARINKKEIACCFSLVMLNVSHNPLESLAFLNDLPSLEELEATHLKLKTLSDIDPVKCKKLIELDLSNNQLQDNSLSVITGLKSLKVLKLANNLIREAGEIVSLKCLVQLNLSSNQIESIKNFNQFSELEVLDVSNNGLKDWSEIVLLDECPLLADLNLSQNPVMEGRSLDDISTALSNLQRLNNCQVLNGVVVIETEADSIQNRVQQELKKMREEMLNLQTDFTERVKKAGKTLESLNCDDDAPTEDTATEVKSARSESARSESKKLSKNRLTDALYYSKQLGDKNEPECKVS